MKRPRSRPSAALLLWLAAAIPAQQEPPANQKLQPLRSVDTEPEPWRTVRSGEGFRARVFGTDVESMARDRRSSSSWEAGFGPAFGAEDADVQASAHLYFWRHPADGDLLRGVIGVVYNELLWAQPAGAGGFERVVTFGNDTAPWSVSERVDGVAQDREQLAWGYVRPGAGYGYRRRVGAEQDNLFATDLIVEPGLLWSARGDRTDPAFVLPETTFELRARLQLRLDLLERNLLELPHRGVALGADVVRGWRAQWRDWGLPGVETRSGDDGDAYLAATAYAFGIGDLPLAGTERQRVFASIHAGHGDDVDRFSAPRIGGGPDRRGIEFDTTFVPLLPGAARNEFFPDHYLIASAGLRQEVAFFAFVDVGTTVAWLDRDREASGVRTRQDDRLTSVFAHLNSGCFGSIRIQLGYAYGFDVVRDGDRGGSEALLLVTGRF